MAMWNSWEEFWSTYSHQNKQYIEILKSECTILVVSLIRKRSVTIKEKFEIVTSFW